MGLLDPQILSLLQGDASLDSTKGGGLLGGGLLGGGMTFKPKADEGWTERMFGSDDPRDPRGNAMMALSIGLMQGKGFGGALGAYQDALRDHEDRSLRRAASNMVLGKNALELQGMLTNTKRDQSIQAGLKKLQGDELSQQNRAAVAPVLDSQSADEFGTPGLGGLPMYSMGGAPGVPSSMQGQQAGTAPSSPLVSDKGASAPMGASRGNYTQGLSNRFMKQAEVYAANGDFTTANKLYEQAAKWMPEVHKIEVAMHQGQPVNVITMKDGNQVLSAFAPTPKTHWADTGGAVQAIDEYSMQPRGTFKKSMTPGETASNQVAWANNRNATERLAFDRSQAGKPQLVDGAWHYPPSESNPQGSVIQPQLPAGMVPKLTEVQANATQFATRIEALAEGLIGREQFGAQPTIEAIKRLRFEGGANKAAQDPAKVGYGRAQLKIAEALEDLIDRNLQASGARELLTAYRDARATLAKVYDVEKSLNAVTGNIDAQKVAKLFDKGRPLTNELRTIAEVSKAFPKATQLQERMGSLPGVSPLDFATFGAISGASGNPGFMSGLLLRPAARNLALSPAIQRGLLAPPAVPAASAGLLGQAGDDLLSLGLFQTAPLLGVSR